MARKTKIRRKTKETDISVELNLDGKGKANIKTGIGFLNHMLELFAYHGLFDLNLIVKKSDLDVDMHHTNEDIGICLGEAFKKALGAKKGINRFGASFVPMDEALAKARVVADISSRPSLHFTAPKGLKGDLYDLNAAKHFFNSFASASGINMHIDILKGGDFHHALEAVFKVFGRALCEATRIEPRRKGKTPSTKGKL
ncbi:MAG: imidazoleglycerol-phosphate dehydratase HisB [Candidatus Omnitrophica bacterium]|nr:imidazoleglycerol-phosphate dehydratase HisB [Candidatus Omnitrophota bacterium]